jgi:hypothetical protein
LHGNLLDSARETHCRELAHRWDFYLVIRAGVKYTSEAKKRSAGGTMIEE